MTESEKQQQKLASLGMLSAGIAHEIQNPLNFVINFSKMSEKLLKDLEEILEDVCDDIDEEDAEDMTGIIEDLSTNLQKIQEHGTRAIDIIQGILLISRGKEGEHLPTDIPKLVHEYIWLSYHAMRAKDKSFNVSIRENYPEEMPRLMVIPQDLSRAVLNIMNNACYALKCRQAEETGKGNNAYTPTIDVTVSCKENNSDNNEGGAKPYLLSISVKDNGCGIPENVKEKLFHENITTKPVGEGTGLGMQITHDIIVANHHGEILVDTAVGKGTTVTFLIPVSKV
ncbi:MAG: two-component sensor histidine kinase [Prevotella sp.]|nr:two-component sensor histidine kinase [Prevotella sp.]